MNDVVPQGLIRLKRLAALHRTMSSSLTFEEVLGLVAESGVDLVGAASCIVLLQEGEQGLRICAALGVDPAAAADFVAPMEESVLDKLRKHLGLPGTQKIVALPIMSDHVLQGLLVVVSEVPLTAEETLFLSSLADQAATTLGMAHLRESLVSRERRLQDKLAQSRRLVGELEALIHSVAQDLRGPLRTLTGAGELLLDQGGEELLAGGGGGSICPASPQAPAGWSP